MIAPPPTAEGKLGQRSGPRPGQQQTDAAANRNLHGEPARHGRLSSRVQKDLYPRYNLGRTFLRRASLRCRRHATREIEGISTGRISHLVLPHGRQMPTFRRQRVRFKPTPATPRTELSMLSTGYRADLKEAVWNSLCHNRRAKEKTPCSKSQSIQCRGARSSNSKADWPGPGWRNWNGAGGEWPISSTDL